MKPIRLTILASCALGLAACGPEEPCHDESLTDSAIEGITEWPATRDSESGHYSVTIKPVVPIERNEHFSVDVGVTRTDAGKKAETGEDLEVRIDADMPAHRHGMNTRPEIVKTGDLQYRADGMLFHMSGDWVITVNVGGETVAFPVSIE